MCIQEQQEKFFSGLSVKFIKLHKRLCCFVAKQKKLDYHTETLVKENSPFSNPGHLSKNSSSGLKIGLNI